MSALARDVHICFVGPMVGRNPGFPNTAGDTLAEHFARAGYSVTTVSSHPNRYVRVLDIVQTLLALHSKVDVQCLQVFSGPSFVVADVASFLGRHLGQKLIYHLHGGALPIFMSRYPRWAERVLRRADAIVAPSTFLARAARDRGFEVQVIPNLLDISQYPFRQRSAVRPVLLWMRAFHAGYNPQLALRVVAHLRDTVPGIKLTMAGKDKGLLEQVTKLAEELGLDSIVQFPGFLNMAGKVAAGQAHDIYLNTNHVDNMPVTVLEMAAMGLPIVATNVGGIPDLLSHEETALLVPDGDEEAMVRAVLRLLSEPDLVARLSSNGRQLAQKSSWDNVRPLWEAVFRQVMEGDRL